MPELIQPVKAQSVKEPIKEQPVKTKKQVVSEFRQAEIITAARKVFAEKGYIAATVDEIAALAALAKGTIYVYFESKEQIYNAVLENDLDTLRDLTLENIASAQTAREKIAAYVNTRFKYCEERRDFFRIMHIEPSGSPVLSKAKARGWLVEPVRQLTSAIENAIAENQIGHWPAETLAWTVVDLTSGALQRRLSATPTTTARQDADFLIKFIHAALSPTAS
ncbi:MAG TPA: TetR/AcrR family transcriptional regulator [Candidatus Angelobacter sp.]|nr:TetR/AcrR family transcriptional regulator [Candidatus Angelobacter sp.]